MSPVSAQAALQRARSHSEPGMAVRTCSAERRRVRPTAVRAAVVSVGSHTFGLTWRRSPKSKSRRMARFVSGASSARWTAQPRRANIRSAVRRPRCIVSR
jgi:hypothetical protein